MLRILRILYGNTGKNWGYRFFAKQKPNVPKARKSDVGTWRNNTYYVNGSYCKMIYFVYKIRKCPLNKQHNVLDGSSKLYIEIWPNVIAFYSHPLAFTAY